VCLGLVSWIIGLVSRIAGPGAGAVVDPRIAGRCGIESIADAVVAAEVGARPIRRKRGFDFERQNHRGRLRGFLEKRSPRLIVLACSVHVTPA
jgi:hypothetical protein